MKDKILIIDDEKCYIDSVFIPNMKLWGIDYDIITNKTFGDVKEEKLESFIKEIVDIIRTDEKLIEVVFIDLGLNKAIDSPSMGYRVVKRIREEFITIPIVALTRFSKSEIMEEGYLYDLDRYIRKTEFGEIGAVNFNGIIHQVIMKREIFIKRISEYFHKFEDSNSTPSIHTLKAFGKIFTSENSNMEIILTDSEQINGEIDSTNNFSVILFADLCNSTSIKLKMGFYEGLNLTRIHNKIITEIISNFNGEVVKYIGDCVMARFNYLSAKDVTPDAINAAIRIQEELRAYNARYRKNADFKIESKIGISFGQVINFYGNDPQGPCVDETARLECLAKPNQIIVSSSLAKKINTSGIVSKVGEATSRDPDEYIQNSAKVTLKGIKDKQNVHEIFWAEEIQGIKEV